MFLDGLLYFTAFGAVLTMFASIVGIVIWLVKTLFAWVTAEPDREADMVPQNLDYLKRAGQ